MIDDLIFLLTDVQLVRKVSVNIDDFDMYAQEVQRNYLQKLLGDKLYAALIAAPAEARFVKLLEGEVYVDGETIIFRGVKLYCAYLWLYLYMNDSSMNVTPIGVQLFKDEDAENKESKAAYRNAREHFLGSADGMEEPTLAYLRANIVTYPEFSESDEIEQAELDNFGFKVFGDRYEAPDNFTSP